MNEKATILDHIGNTPLLKLNKVTDSGTISTNLDVIWGMSAK
jgi:hypothetical protein